MSKGQKLVIDRVAAMERVELVRMAHGLTKAKLCSRLGLQRPNYSKLLRGDGFLTSDQLYLIWQHFGADPAYIMAGRTEGNSAGLMKKLSHFA